MTPDTPPPPVAPVPPLPEDTVLAAHALRELAGLLRADAEELVELVATLYQAGVVQPLIDKTTRLAAATQAIAAALDGLAAAPGAPVKVPRVQF